MNIPIGVVRYDYAIEVSPHNDERNRSPRVHVSVPREDYLSGLEPHEARALAALLVVGAELAERLTKEGGKP